MKKVVFLFYLLLIAASVFAQGRASNAEILKAANAEVCEAYALADPCSDAQVLAAWCAANKQEPCTGAGRPVDQIVYSTFATYANTVLVPKAGGDRFERRKQVLTERLVQVIQRDKARCVAVFAAAQLPTDGCQ